MANMKIKINRVAEIVQDATLYLGESSFIEYFTQPSSFKQMWKKSRRKLDEMFGDVIEYINIYPDVHCPAISYGHLGCMGAEIRYPEHSDPNMTQMVDSVAEGIKWMKRGWDFKKFSASDIFKQYDAYHQKLKEDFPDRNISFAGLGRQGPVTSAVLMRGQDFYIDMYENPEESKEFLRLMTDSIIEFEKFIRKINNITAADNISVDITDDFAGFVAPDMFDEFVLPYWNRLCEGLTVTGSRRLHCEGMTRDHLPYINKCGISHFQPSVSPLLTCKMLAEDLDIPYDWMLPTFELASMDKLQIEKWVDDTVSVSPGADLVRAQAGRHIFENHGINGAQKVYNYLNAFKNMTDINYILYKTER